MKKISERLKKTALLFRKRTSSLESRDSKETINIRNPSLVNQKDPHGVQNKNTMVIMTRYPNQVHQSHRKDERVRLKNN
jgi:hypothetical protein